MNHILDYNRQIFLFIILFCIIILLLSVFFKMILIKFNPKGAKLRIYGILLGLSDKDILLFSLLTIRYLFFFYCINYNNYGTITTDIHFYLLLFPIIIYDLLSKRYFTIFIDFLNTLIIYFALFSKMVFFNYFITINNVWYVGVIMSLLIIFMIIYVTYFYIKDIDYILKNNKYIKRKIKGV